MEEYDVRFKKKFGQNFLRDKAIVEKIAGVCDITKEDLVIEVGPGGAILTKELAKVAKEVLAYEIDDDLEDELARKLNGVDNVKVLFKDFLDSDLLSDISNYDFKNIYFVSNVPYYITTPIIMKIINSGVKFKKICMMVQKEVGDRFSTSYGNKSYGSITVFLNYYYNVKKEFYVSKEEFIPVPKVDSVVVSFEERDDRPFVKDMDLFQKVVHDSFQYKRKNIRNNLKKYNLDIVTNVLKRHNLDLSVRAEQLDISIFVELANELSS